MISKIAQLSIALLFSAGAVSAASIGIADFDSPMIDELDVTIDGTVAGPYISGPLTFSTDDGSIRYFSSTSTYPNCTDGCITTNSTSEAGQYMDIVFDTVFDRVGAFVGSYIAPQSVTATFFDIYDNLLGTVSFADLAAGDLFLGFEDTAGIKRLRFTDNDSTNAVLSVDRVHFENIALAAIPVPAGLPLLLGAFGMLGLTRSRRS